MLSRTSKQLLIGAIYVVIVAGLVGGIYYSKNKPTCNDGVKNGREEGVDCGTAACGKACEAPVQAIQIKSFQSVQTPAGDYDAVVQIYNPNSNYGVSEGVYTFDGGNGSSVLNDELFYMLPGQTKYLVLTGLNNPIQNPKIQRVDWERLSDSQDNPLVVSREALTRQTNGAVYEAVITNASNFDFDSVEAVVVVTDAAGNLIATNTSNLQTVLSRTERSVRFIWPFALPADVSVHVEAGTNIFNNSNFIKTNGTQEKFQQYY